MKWEQVPGPGNFAGAFMPRALRAVPRVVQSGNPCRFVNLGFGSILPPKFKTKK